MSKNDLIEAMGLDEVDTDSIVFEFEFVNLLNRFMEEKYCNGLNKAYSGAQTNASIAWGVTKTMVWKVLKGDKAPTKAMLADIKYQKHTVTFYSKEKEDQKPPL